MTLAESLIADLDEALGEVGEDIVLQRLSADPVTGGQISTCQANCRANVRAHQPQDLTALPGEAPNSAVILSPTDLARELWPGLPSKDDRIVIQGRFANVQTVSPIYVAGTLVRIDLLCSE